MLEAALPHQEEQKLNLGKMTSSKIRDSVQVGNGLQADFRDLRNTKDPQTEERDEVSLINGNRTDYRERGET